MKSHTIAFAILAVLAVMMVPAFDSDGASIDTPDGTFEFDNRNGGTLTFTVNNTNGGSFVMNVVVQENGRTVASVEDIDVPAGERVVVSVPMGDFKDVGTHQVRVICTPAGNFEGNEFNAEIKVGKNLLNNAATYIVIAIVIIVIAVFAYLKIRDSPKKKTEMTFEQLEAERKAEMAAKSDKRKSKDAAPTTERQRYLADKKKKD